MSRAALLIVLLGLLLAACVADEPAAAPSPATASPGAPTQPVEAVTASGAPSPAGSPDQTPDQTGGATESGAAVGGEAPDVGADAWTVLADAPEPLSEVAAAAFGGALWVAGGFAASGDATTTVQVYDPTFDQWDAGPPLPEAVHHSALVAAGDVLYLVGGYTGSDFDAPTDAVRRFDPATGVWEDGPALPEARAAGAAAWDGSRVVYAGGVGPDGLAGGVFTLEGEEWAEVGPLARPREHLAAASDGQGRVWVLLGRTGGLDSNLSSVEVVEGDTIRTLGELPTARGGVAGFHHPAAGACVVGGESPDATFAEVECMDAEGEVTVLPELSIARHGLGAAVVEGTAYVGLGGPEPRLTVSPALEALRLDG